MNTRIQKSKILGWNATSEIELGNSRNGGVIVSHASVAKREGSFLNHLIFQDYSARIAFGGNRSTEKAVTELHSSIDFEAVIKAANDHYEVSP